jgi:hypothetical protein
MPHGTFSDSDEIVASIKPVFRRGTQTPPPIALYRRDNGVFKPVRAAASLTDLELGRRVQFARFKVTQWGPLRCPSNPLCE